MSAAKYVRARHLAAMLSDYHRFLTILSGIETVVRGSVEGHLGCCTVLEDIRAALKEAAGGRCPDEDAAYLRGYSDCAKATGLPKEAGHNPGP